MAVPAVFMHTQMVVAMQKLHSAINSVCNSAGDLCFDEHVLLTNVCEVDMGYPLSRIKSCQKATDTYLYHISSLEEKELVVYIRNSLDRRTLALKATTKGYAKLALIDESCAAMLILEHKKWSEAEFEYLINKMHSFPNDNLDELPRQSRSIFSGEFLSLIQKYHRNIAIAAAYYGLSSLQAAMLCVLGEIDAESNNSSNGRIGSESDNSEGVNNNESSIHMDGADAGIYLDDFEKLTKLPKSVVELQLDDLAKKELITSSESYALTDKGNKRIISFIQQISPQLNKLFSNRYTHHEDWLEDLGEYCIYLFA